MGDLLFTESTQIPSYLGLHTADKGYPSIYQSAFGQKWDFPASLPLASRSFPRRAPVSRESGQFSFSKLFFSTNHCTARGIFSILDPWISTKSAAISLFMLRFAWNSELKLLLPSPFEPRGRFWVLFVRLFVILDTASWICCHFFVYAPICMKFGTYASFGELFWTAGAFLSFVCSFVCYPGHS